MRRLLAYGVIAVVVLTGCKPEATTRPQDLPPCPTEDSGTNCFWDAKTQGNGQGHSFWVDADGKAHRVS